MSYQISGNNLIQSGGHVNNSNSGFVVPISQLANVVSLGGGNDGAVTNFVAFASYASPTTTAQYQVPNNKKLVVLTIQVTTNSANTQIMFGYGTAALIANSTATAPTGVVYYCGNTNAGAAGLKTDSTGSGTQTWNVPMSFPENTYPFFKANGGSFHINLIGILIDSA